MKRFIIVCLCFSLLSFLIIPSFADERFVSDDLFSNRDLVSGRFYSLLTFSSNISYTPYQSTHFDYSGYLYLSGSRLNFDYIAFRGDLDSSLMLVRYQSSSFTVLILADGSINPDWDGILYFDSPVLFPNSFVDWYNSFSTVFDSSVSSGVSSFISWTGLAFRDIINSPFILPLIGLFVALFFALPWVISKIKQLIKGY